MFTFYLKHNTTLIALSELCFSQLPLFASNYLSVGQGSVTLCISLNIARETDCLWVQIRHVLAVQSSHLFTVIAALQSIVLYVLVCMLIRMSMYRDWNTQQYVDAYVHLVPFLHSTHPSLPSPIPLLSFTLQNLKRIIFLFSLI